MIVSVVVHRRNDGSQLWSGRGGDRATVMGTHVPSGLLDSGMTRSSVRGSTVMPAVLAFGKRSGLDMIAV